MKELGESNIVVLGATRGLGYEFVKCCAEKYGQVKWMLIGRKVDRLDRIRTSLTDSEILGADLSKTEDQDLVVEKIGQFSPDLLLYFAGGGPYGEFENKQWKDHMWAFQVSFLFPARLLHYCLKKWIVGRFVAIGSQVAERKADPLASSYCASKHALMGLMESVVAENKSWQIGLYSPSYMDTELLPKNALPRHQGVEILSPSEVAKDLMSWLEESNTLGYRPYPR